MPTRLLLEGRDLEELLAQVRDEHGPEAKIVSAEKLRSGGVGGLFGHQKFELTVEIPDSGSPSAAPEAPTVATLTIEDLAAMADAAESRNAPPASEEVLAAAGATPAAAHTARQPANGSGFANGGGRSTTSVTFADALAVAQSPAPRDGSVHDAATPGPVSRDSAVPDHVTPDPAAGDPAAREAGSPDSAAREAGMRKGPGKAAAPAGRVVTRTPGGKGFQAAIAPPAAPAPAPATAMAPTAAEALNRLLHDAPTDEVATPSVRPFRPTAATPVARLGMRPLAPQTDSVPADPPAAQFTRQETTVPVDVSEVVATIERPRTGDSAERLAATYGPQPAAPAKPTGAGPATGAAATPADKPDRTALPRRLQSLGVPADIAFRATAPDTYAAVVEAFQTLPTAEPAPDGPGETLVVIGESTHAVEVARCVAGTLRLEFDDILFAGRNAVAAGVQPKRRVTGGHDARLWAKRLRKADSPSIVAVEAALDESGWAASIVEAIRPAAVWVVVDASRKTSDVAHHLHGLRRVDALALRSTLSSGDPASALSLRVPIAMLDGRPPTPYAWAAMLCERLSLVGG